jgi:hypothetical protein
MGFDTWLGFRSCSNPVPPEGKRTKRFVMGAVRWEPGRKERAPFSFVHCSNASQKPSAVGGEVYLCGVSGADQEKNRRVGGIRGRCYDFMSLAEVTGGAAWERLTSRYALEL